MTQPYTYSIHMYLFMFAIILKRLFKRLVKIMHNKEWRLWESSCVYNIFELFKNKQQQKRVQKDHRNKKNKRKQS